MKRIKEKYIDKLKRNHTNRLLKLNLKQLTEKNNRNHNP